MKNRLANFFAVSTIVVASGGFAAAQDAEVKEMKSTRIVVNGDKFEQIRKRVAEQLEKAAVSAEVRERVLQEMDAVQLGVSSAREKSAEARADAIRQSEPRVKLKDGNEQVEVLIGGDKDNITVLRADVLRNLDQKYRIGVACGTSDNEETDSVGGLTVRSVFPDSPASKAGLREKDQLLMIDGKQLESVGQLMESVQSAGKAGKELELEIVRGEEKLKIKVKPSEIKDTDKLVESLQLNMPPTGFVLSPKDVLDQLRSQALNSSRGTGNVFTFESNDDLKKEIELLRKEIQELKEMIKELHKK